MYFQVPYVSSSGAPKTDAENEKNRARSMPASAARRVKHRASSWIREEFETDRAGQALISLPQMCKLMFKCVALSSNVTYMIGNAVLV